MKPKSTEEKGRIERQKAAEIQQIREDLEHALRNLSPEQNFDKESFKNYIDTGKNITDLQVKDGQITAWIKDMDGNMSAVNMTILGIQTQVQNMEGDISNISQQADRISSTVANMEGDISNISQQADRIDLIISGDTPSSLALTKDMAQLIADKIDILGYVTITSLNTPGALTVDGGNVSLYGYLTIYENGNNYASGGYIGYADGNNGESSTQGMKMADSSDSNYFIATSGGIRMTYGDWYAVYCTSNGVTVAADKDFRFTSDLFSKSGGDCGTASYPWAAVYADTAEIQTSDRRKKNSITYDLRKYEEFFRRLKPAGYKLNNGMSGRTHLGFISQDVEKTMEELSIPATEFGGFIKAPLHETGDNGEPDPEKPVKDYDYSLRYAEFIALNTHMIQKLMDRVDMLEKEVEKLKKPKWKGTL